MSLSFVYGDKLRDIANRSEASKEDVTLNYIVSQLFALIINNPSRGTVHGQQNNSLRLQANKCSLARPLHMQKRVCQETLQGNHTRPGCDNIFQTEVSSLKSSLLKSERNDVYRRFNCVKYVLLTLWPGRDDVTKLPLTDGISLSVRTLLAPRPLTPGLEGL